MMPTKWIFASALAYAIALSGAYAQTDTPAPAAPAPTESAAPASPAATPAEAPAPAETEAPVAPAPAASLSPKEVRQQCRQQQFAQGLRGTALRAAVDDCFGKARPDLAAAVKCRREADSQNLTGTALRQFMRGCRSKAM